MPTAVKDRMNSYRSFAMIAAARGFCMSACLAVLALSGCDDKAEPSTPRQKARPTARNVVLIVVDTLRADKLGCYGNSLGLTPKIDKLAEEGFRFDFAYAHAPWTLPSTASLLTSAYPQQHGAGGSNGEFDKFTGINKDVRTLAECFWSQGYDTAAIVNVLFLAPKFGLNRGFDTYDFQQQGASQANDRKATEVTDWAINWMKEHGKSKDGRPFFLLVHYFDPHLQYDPPEKFRQKYALPEDKTADPTLFGSAADMLKFRAGGIPVDQIPLKRLEALYNGEIAYTDEEIGRLLGEMKKMSLDENTVVVLTSDHGEEFFDHGGYEHGHTLYDEMIRVPLIIRSKGDLKPGFSVRNVGHIDVAPTLCSLADVAPESIFQGRDLVTLMRESKLEKDEPVFSQGNMWGGMLRAYRDGRFKLIKRPVARELYNILGDPMEKKNLCGDADFSAKCDEYETLLDDFGVKIGTRPGINVALTKDEENQAIKGGYAGGKKSASGNPDADVEAGDAATSQPADGSKS